jgi:hypothetical protein
LGANPAGAATRQAWTSDTILTLFAAEMKRRYGARVYLFGSRARGEARSDSDYDLIAVSDSFASEDRRWRRCPDRYQMWWQVGGWGKGLDLWCFTKREFAAQSRGLGFVGSASRRGEIVEVRVSDAA